MRGSQHIITNWIGAKLPPKYLCWYPVTNVHLSLPWEGSFSLRQTMVIAEFLDAQGDAWAEDIWTTLPKAQGTTHKREQEESKNQTIERRAVKFWPLGPDTAIANTISQQLGLPALCLQRLGLSTVNHGSGGASCWAMETGGFWGRGRHLLQLCTHRQTSGLQQRALL